MKEQGWCGHTREEVTPIARTTYYWEFCPICGLPKDKNKTVRTIDEIFCRVLDRITLIIIVVFGLVIALLIKLIFF